ncbi:MAG: restriction endonuclease subunit S [Gammaproteobacteria bacterium]
MAGEWRVSTWGDEVSFEYGKALRGHEKSQGRVRVFGSNGPIGWTDEPLAQGPGVILGRKGAYRGVQFSREPFFVIDTAYYVLPKSELDMRWLYYAIKHHKLGEVDDGSPIPSTTRAAVYMLDLDVPPLSEQRAIAHILGALDDKIELNRRMSETLEAMARALFKSWFVDFDPVRAKMEGRWKRVQSLPGLPAHLYDVFPDRLVDSELGEIPEGWEARRLGDLADIDKGLSYKGAGLADDGGLPMINLGCFAGGGHFKAENIKRYRGDYKDRHLVQSGDLVIANTDVTQQRVILGSPALVPKLDGERHFLFTHHTFACRFKPGAVRWRRFAYFALLQPEFREIAEGFATGTTVLALPRDGLIEYSVVLPPESLLMAFERQVSPILSAADVGLRQSRTLAALRDTLLPKLISGELRVKYAKSFIGRTTR